MANIFEDLQHQAILSAGNTFATVVNATAGLVGVDLKDAGANRITAIAATVTVTGAGNVTFKLQESDDNSSFTDVTGAVFTATTAAGDLAAVSFNVVKRYVRFFGTLNSGTSVTCVLLFLAMRKSTPASFGGFVNDTFN